MIRWLDHRARELFAAAGLDTLERLCACTRGEVVSRARTRICRRLVLAGRGYFLKSQVVPPPALPLRRWPSYLLRGSPLVREARNLGRLTRLGVAVPPLVCTGSSRRWWGLPHRAVLITSALADHVDLARLAAADPERAAAAAAVAEELAAGLHRRGWVLGGLKYRNILVDRTGGIALIDLPDLRRSFLGKGRRRDRRILARERVRAFPSRS